MFERSLTLNLLAVHPGEVFYQILPFALVAALLVALIYLLFAARVRRPADKSRWNLWEIFLYLMMLLSVIMLAATAFYPMLRHEHLKGWGLFVHMIWAGFFVFLLPALALTWCEASRFETGRQRAAVPATPPRFYWFPKLMFWILLASGLVVSLTMLLSMTTLFGTRDLQNLLDLHRYSGLIAVIAMLFHLNGVLVQRFGWR
jgi:hypothetical protein